jgi:hypothetical protein
MDGASEGEGVRGSAANPAGFDGRPNPSLSAIKLKLINRNHPTVRL